MLGILTAVSEMSGILLKVWEVSGKSGLKLFIVSCVFASIPQPPYCLLIVSPQETG